MVLKTFLHPFNVPSSERGISLYIEEKNEIPSSVCVDWKIYLQALFYIVQNAIKFSNEGGIISI
jgi:signal transduction histidine kinase